MRVISGSRRGRTLQTVSGKATRPTTDKVKEAIFNLLDKSIFKSGGIGLDLYAGTGGLGIEALSRGMEKVIFVDKNRNAVETIKKNLHALAFTEQSEVYKNDATRALKALVKRQVKFNLIFLDPPYAEQQVRAQLSLFHLYNLLQPQGQVIVESGKDQTSLPETVEDISLVKWHTYGDTQVHIYKKKEMMG